jgi:hypothetical protein
VSPHLMGLGPVSATGKLLARTGQSIRGRGSGRAEGAAHAGRIARLAVARWPARPDGSGQDADRPESGVSPMPVKAVVKRAPRRGDLQVAGERDPQPRPRAVPLIAARPQLPERVLGIALGLGHVLSYFRNRRVNSGASANSPNV